METKSNLIDLSSDNDVGERDLDLMCHEILAPDVASVSPFLRLLRFDLWSQDSKVVTRSLKTIGDKLASGKDTKAATHRLQFHRCQGAAIIVGVMHRWYDSPRIQALCCLTLHNASFHSGTLVLQAEDIGILDAVLWAMETYPNNVPLQLCACGVMARMVTLKANANIVVNKWNGLRLLSRAIRKFPENEGIQKWATNCLDELIKYEDFRQPVLAIWTRCAVGPASRSIER